MKKITNNMLLIIVGLFFSHLSFGQIVALDDSVFVPSSALGTVGNVLTNDTLLGISISNVSDVTITFDNTTAPAFTINSNGDLFMAPTFSGVYTINYTICETANPTSCDTATVTIIINSVIDANDDLYVANAGSSTVLGSVLNNDTIDGVAIISSQVVLTSLSIPSGFTIDPSGIIIIDPSVPSGTYNVLYQICNVLSPINCDIASVTITINSTIILAMNGVYNDLNADGFINVGDVIDYQFTVSNIATEDVINVIVSDASLSIIGAPIPLLLTGNVDSTNFTATYVLTLADIMLGSVTKNATLSGIGLTTTNSYSTSITSVTSLGITDAIRMNVFVDTNGNGVQDSGEINFDKGEFHYQFNSDGILHNITNPSGVYTIYETNPSNSYDLSYTINPTYVANYFPLTVVFTNVHVLTGSGVTTFNFPVTEIPFTDVSVYLVPSSGPIPGFTYNNSIIYKNNGNQLIPNGTLVFNHDSALSITSVPGSTPITNGFTYDFSNLVPGETRVINISITTPIIPIVSLGDFVTNTVSVNLPLISPVDVHPSDNNATVIQEIRGSYDPNDKNEIHGNKILFSSFSSSDYLTYIIRFENTGTGNAINIKVDDVLNSQLDPSSITMLTASAPYTLERLGNNLTWKFDGINLPPSVVGSEIGKGFIVFKVKPNSGYAVGDIIPNSANIFFDFNPAIVTNTCTTEFVATLGIANNQISKALIFPNPFNDYLNIKSDLNIKSIDIVDLNGRIIESFKQNVADTILNLEKLTSGMYLIKIVTETGTSTQKVIKK